MDKNQCSVGLAALLAMAVTTLSGSVAATTTATYPDETVGPFNQYDLSSGSVALLDGVVGSSSGAYDGYYQGYVNEHLLDGTSVTSSKLNTDYEITALANFSGTFMQTSPTSVTFGLTPGSGQFKLFYDDTIDRDLIGDSGFDDSTLPGGAPLLEGSVVGGSGIFFLTPGGLYDGLGLTTLDISVTGTAAGVFNPDIVAIGSVLRLTLDQDGFSSGVTSVQGQPIGPNDLLIEVDGTLDLKTVPIPAAAWLFAGAVGLLGSMARRRRLSP